MVTCGAGLLLMRHFRGSNATCRGANMWPGTANPFSGVAFGQTAAHVDRRFGEILRVGTVLPKKVAVPIKPEMGWSVNQVSIRELAADHTGRTLQYELLRRGGAPRQGGRRESS